MGELSRIGIALDSDLLKRFDRSIEKSGYTNRSEAFRDLIRDRLVREQTAAPDATVVGTVTLIYNHHAHGITRETHRAAARAPRPGCLHQPRASRSRLLP